MNSELYYNIYDQVYSYRETTRDLEELHSILNLSSKKAALDFGCGSGLYTKELEKFYGSVTGVDIDEAARTRFHKNVKKSQFKAHLTDLERYSVVFSFFNVLNYIHDRKSLCEVTDELCGHLENEGIFVFDILNAENFEAGLKSRTREVVLNEKKYEYIQTMDVKSDRSMTFSEEILLSGVSLYSKTNQLYLWSQPELVDVIGSKLKFQKNLKSNYIGPNQKRFYFKKEAQ